MLIHTAVSARMFDWSLVARVTCPPCLPKDFPCQCSQSAVDLKLFPHADSIPAPMALMIAVTVSVTIPLSSGHVADCVLL